MNDLSAAKIRQHSFFSTPILKNADTSVWKIQQQMIYIWCGKTSTCKPVRDMV
jgi:hypothetical protein